MFCLPQTAHTSLSIFSISYQKAADTQMFVFTSSNFSMYVPSEAEPAGEVTALYCLGVLIAELLNDVNNGFDGNHSEESSDHLRQ